MKTRGINCTPLPASLRGTQNQKWTVTQAVAELIDNGLGSGRGDASLVSMIYDKRRQVITVLDNGRGMDDIGRLFRLGDTSGRSPGDIGIYGMGGSLAILWLNKSVEVWTLRDGYVSHVDVNWETIMRAEEWPLIPSTTARATPANTPTDLLEAGSGTKIVNHLLREHALFQPSIVRRDLGRIYSPASRSGKRITWEENDEVYPIGEAEMELRDAVNVAVSITTENGDALGVRGRIGTADGADASVSTVRVGFGYRVIKESREFYVNSATGRKFNAAHIAGWLDLSEGWQPYLATAKDAINDQDAWQSLVEAVAEQIQSLLTENEESLLYIKFKGVSLQLQRMLNGDPHKHTTGEAPRHRRLDESESSDREPSERAAPRPPLTQTSIDIRFKGGLDGLLFKQDRDGDSIIVWLNEDNEHVKAVKESAKQSPLIVFFVCSQLATTLIDDNSLLERSFTAEQRRVINTTDEDLRHNRITSMLFECAVQ